MILDSQTLAVLCVVFFAGLVRSTFGFGDALIAMPILVVLVGLQTATPLVALTADTIALIVLLRSWRHVQFRSAWRLTISSAVGVPLGLFLLKGVYESFMQMLLAFVIMGVSAYSFAAPTAWRLQTDRSSYLFGLVAGVLGGAYNTNGPPIVVYGSLRRWSPDAFRATLQGYFLATSFFILLGHFLAGLWTRPVLTLYMWSLPAVLVAVFLGTRLNRALPRERFSAYVYALLFVLGASLFLWTSCAMLAA